MHGVVAIQLESMKATLSLFCTFVALGWALPSPGDSGTEGGRPEMGRRRAMAVDRIVPNVVNLQRISNQPSPRTYWANTMARYLGGLVDGGASAADPIKSTRLSLVQNNSYVATLEVGGEKVQVIVDTGSADTWVLRKNYTCFGFDNAGNRRQATVSALLRPPHRSFRLVNDELKD